MSRASTAASSRSLSASCACDPPPPAPPPPPASVAAAAAAALACSMASWQARISPRSASSSCASTISSEAARARGEDIISCSQFKMGVVAGLRWAGSSVSLGFPPRRDDEPEATYSTLRAPCPTPSEGEKKGKEEGNGGMGIHFLFSLSLFQVHVFAWDGPTRPSCFQAASPSASRRTESMHGSSSNNGRRSRRFTEPRRLFFFTAAARALPHDLGQQQHWRISARLLPSDGACLGSFPRFALGIAATFSSSILCNHHGEEDCDREIFSCCIQDQDSSNSKSNKGGGGRGQG